MSNVETSTVGNRPSILSYIGYSSALIPGFFFLIAMMMLNLSIGANHIYYDGTLRNLESSKADFTGKCFLAPNGEIGSGLWKHPADGSMSGNADTGDIAFKTGLVKSYAVADLKAADCP